jgi:hypothetical protein
MVQLTDYLDYPRSSHNELFDLHYYFTLKAIFDEDEPMDPPAFEVFLVEETSNQL